MNCDSAQIYADIPIVSAAPDSADRSGVEHRLYGILDGAAGGSAADWAELARTEIAAIHAEGRLPILVGGTGLYLRTLLDGIAPVPDVDPVIRAQVRASSTRDNHRRLADKDPHAAQRLGANDSARIARALEVVLSSGRTLTEWQSLSSGGIGETVTLRPLILLPPRPWLYERCDRRFDAMLKSGAIDEVRALLSRGLASSLPVMRAIGVRQIARYLGGEISLEEARIAGRQATRNYAKRQYTWFAHQPPAHWPRFTSTMSADGFREALELIGATA